ncbi:hypothetical protein C0995_011210 [Termitomyces sp. Mi166|nr:hypothetical protein C0995_011210 [Termitomyces sp. Mi166\
MDPSPTMSMDDFNVLNAMVTELGTLVRDMLARMNSNATPAQSPQATTAAEFTPPITAVTANGTSIVAPASLHTCFPDIEAAVITAIIMHEFKAADLHKLDSTNQDKEVAYTFNRATNQFEVSNRATKEYKNPFSVLVPLQCYFNMLGFHLPKYNNMAMGDYSGWGIPATDLLSKHIYAYRKTVPGKQLRASGATRTPGSTPEVCCKFNEGKCTVSLCPWGRPHNCSMCSKADHGKHQHKD